MTDYERAIAAITEVLNNSDFPEGGGGFNRRWMGENDLNIWEQARPSEDIARLAIDALVQAGLLQIDGGDNGG